MKIERLDHLVLTVRDVEATIAFYVQALGMRSLTFGAGRRALAFGQQKINLHPAHAPLKPHALQPTPGSADLCFIADCPISEVVAHLESVGIVIEEGPVPRTGALGAITSVYFRDPDQNLVEVSCYDTGARQGARAGPRKRRAGG
jgi:catechol 2,3-dioxygenase-like lactoylglutathione lyase family enzyme